MSRRGNLSSFSAKQQMNGHESEQSEHLGM